MYSTRNIPMLPIGWMESWIKDKEGDSYKVEHFCRNCKSKKKTEY